MGNAAAGAAETDTFLGERYRRIACRRGSKRVIVTIGRSILVIAWHLLSNPNARFATSALATTPPARPRTPQARPHPPARSPERSFAPDQTHLTGDPLHTCAMAPWVAIADIGTAAGTLVLAAATFVAVRASVRSTRIAERTLLVGQRPVLAPTGPDDPSGSIQFADGRVFPVSGGQALVHNEPGVIYLAIPLRNEGAGLALLHGYRLEGERGSNVADDPSGVARHLRGDPPPLARAFSLQQRDVLISTRRPGFWQAALRDPKGLLYKQMKLAIETQGRITVDVLYGDHEGGQPTVTRFVLLPEAGAWRCDTAHHWNLAASKELRRLGFT